MWQLVRGLQADGVTVILTTHYIEEAEEMADRIGVINRGEIILVEEKAKLMQKLGKKQLTVQLQAPLETLPDALTGLGLERSSEGEALIYTYDATREQPGIGDLLNRLNLAGIGFRTYTTQSSLEDIFVSLVKDKQ